MTRRQKKHSLLVDLRYNQYILNSRRRPKTTYMQLIPNFLKAIKNVLPINTK